MAEKNKRKKSRTKENEKTKQYIVKKTKNKNKGKNNQKKKHSKLKNFIKAVAVFIFVCIVVGGAGAYGFVSGILDDDFKISEEELTSGESNSKILDKDGNLLAVLNGDENREIITLDEMSKYLPEAFVAIEDERFYEHEGVDITRTLSATIKYGLSKIGIGSSDFGGSTITQQLVKLITEEDQRAWQRKVKEISRAYNIEKTISKTQILELYLNRIFLGDKAYGVEVASKYYFNKSAKDLSLAECAFFAGINHSPNWYKPFEDSEEMQNKIKNRTKVVLAKMKELGKIETEEEYNKAIEEVNNGLAFNKGEITQVVYSYHTDAAIEQILTQLQEEHSGWNRNMAKSYLYGGNFTIYTTQDTAAQNTIQAEAEKSQYIAKSRKTKDTETGEYLTTQASMTIIDQKTGYVVAVVGGTGPKTTAQGLNRATQQPKQTGSSMKPLAAVAPGIQNGTLTAGTVVDDVATNFGGWTPHNSYGGNKGLVTVRYGITISSNIANIKALQKVGVDNSIEFLKQAGITTLTPEDRALPLAIGGLTKGVTTLEMAAAYAMIANDGVYIEPTFYTKVVDSEGKTVLEPKQETRRVMSEQAAYIMKDILRGPVSSGTATMCRITGMDVCAKTGTTDNYVDRWLCGFTPYYTAATWLGYDYNSESTSGRLSGSNPAGTMWANVMRSMHTSLPNKKFSQPSGLVTATICKSSGLLATEDCKNDPRGNQVYSEIFVKGTVPTATCTCHVKAKICEDTGKLATDFCPHIVEKVFITRPNSKDSKSWRNAADAEYMLPEELENTCDVHTEEQKDNEKPVIKLKGAETIVIKINGKYEEQGATATDNKDGDLTSKITTVGKVDTSKVGTYTVTYTVKDSTGNETKATRTVKVIEDSNTGNQSDKPNGANTNTNTNENTNSNNGNQKSENTNTNTNLNIPLENETTT